jgi:transcription antitermination factor NusG
MSSLETRRWYAVYSKRRREEIVQFNLERKGLVVFFPRLLLLNSFSTRPRIVPLFPNYLFVCAQSPIAHDHVRWSPGVMWVVNIDGSPTPLEEGVVDFLRRRATPAGVITMHSSLAVRQEGENVSERVERIMKVLLNQRNSNDRVRVLLQLFTS